MNHPILRRATAFLTSLALGLLLLFTASGTTARAQDGSHKLIGHTAPAFALKDFQHKTLHLSQFRGRVVLLNFWASWCAPCQEEIPNFVKWQSQYHGKLQVIGVTMDDAAAKAQATAKKLKINYPVVAGTASMGRAYGGIYGLPVTFLIDAHGRIRAEYQGASHVTQIHAEIQHLLAH